MLMYNMMSSVGMNHLPCSIQQKNGLSEIITKSNNNIIIINKRAQNFHYTKHIYKFQLLLVTKQSYLHPNHINTVVSCIEKKMTE